MDRDQLKDTNYFKPDLFDGVQIAYSWRQLESQKDVYDFQIIEDDLAYLNKLHRKLFIQFEDVSFSMKWNHAPAYLLEESIYQGGANKQYRFADNSETQHSDLGWVIRRWDPAVQSRLAAPTSCLSVPSDDKQLSADQPNGSATYLLTGGL